VAQFNTLTPQYGWNKKAQRYYDLSSGTFVASKDIRAALDASIVAGKKEIDNLTQKLLKSQISLADWQTQMAHTIKLQHVAAASLSVGGWAQATPAVWGRAGAELKKQYAFLQRLALQIESGKQPLNGSLVVRASMYGEAQRSTYEQSRRAEMKTGGAVEERRELHPGKTCGDCHDQAVLGWQPIGTLKRIGDSQCRMNCNCTFSYRDAQGNIL